jgi:hypothetical protein
MKRTTLLSGVAGATALGSAFGLAQTPNAVAWFAGLTAAAFAAWGVRRHGEDDGWIPLAGGVLAGVAVVIAVAQWLLVGASGPEALVGGGVAACVWAAQAAVKPR